MLSVAVNGKFWAWPVWTAPAQNLYLFFYFSKYSIKLEIFSENIPHAVLQSGAEV